MIDARSSSAPLAGKLVLVTGASSGIGLVTAQALAARGCGLLLVCRDAVRGEMARLAVARAATGAPPRLFRADLSSLADVAALAAEVERQVPKLDGLVNNAAGIFTRRELSPEGFEKTFATNHLAPFLLSNLLLGRLQSAGESRIVNVSAESPLTMIDFDNLQSERHHNFLGAYFRSKLANIVCTFELARRLAGSGITANCMSPGPTRTRFGDDLTGLPRLFPLLMKRIPLLFATAEKSAAGLVALAGDVRFAGVTGRFFLRRREIKPKPVFHDREVAARLWRVSEEFCRPFMPEHQAGE